jgi:hypothetical protein
MYPGSVQYRRVKAQGRQIATRLFDHQAEDKAATLVLFTAVTDHEICRTSGQDKD